MKLFRIAIYILAGVTIAAGVLAFGVELPCVLDASNTSEMNKCLIHSMWWS